LQLKPNIKIVKIMNLGGNNERYVIDLKGAFKLIMLLPKAGVLQAKMAEVGRGFAAGG